MALIDIGSISINEDGICSLAVRSRYGYVYVAGETLYGVLRAGGTAVNAMDAIARPDDQRQAGRARQALQMSIDRLAPQHGHLSVLLEPNGHQSENFTTTGREKSESALPSQP